MPSNLTPFLVTTALEEFWDASSPQVFLGEWCKLYERRAAWKDLSAPVLPCPWRDRRDVELAFQYVDRTYEWLLPILGHRLNEIHETKFGDRYWRIVAGPWLLHFLHFTYDHYRRICSAIENYPDFTTLGLAPESFVIPSDTLEFIRLAKGDRYNLQLFTRMLDGMGRSFPLKAISTSAQSTVPPVKRGTLARRFIISILGKLSAPLAPIILRNAYFPTFKNELSLAARAMGRIAFSYAPNADTSGVPVEPRMRARLEGLAYSEESGGFRDVVVGMIGGEIPISLMEGFATVGEVMVREYPRLPKIIFSAIGWHFDEAFKRWAATCMERGTRLVGTQHGGNYGCFHEMPFHELEFKALDYFYSWGWTIKEYELRIKPFPAPKLIGRKKIGADNSRKGILYVTTDSPRFSATFQYSEYHHLSYIEWQIRFLGSIGPRLGSVIRARPHAEDSGWGYVDRWREVIPNLAIETWAIPFVDSLADCRLYVSDHIETTFVEALAADKPSILFYNPAHRRLREEAKPFYSMLREVGILHDTPESAASAIEEAYPDVESWWNLPARQEARKAFCRQYALSGPDSLSLWAEEFRTLAKNPGLIS